MLKLFTTRLNCPACGKPEPKILIDRRFDDSKLLTFLKSYYNATIPTEILYDQRFRIGRCKCGFVWQLDILNNEGMGLLYEKWIDSGVSQQKRTAAKIHYYQSLAKNLARCKMLLADIDEPKSLDYGMGWGHWATMALAFGFDSYGLELSSTRIAYASQRGIKCVQDLAQLQPNTFHLINAEQVLEHVPDPKETFDVFSRLLVTGGIVQVAVPDGTKEIKSLKKNKWEPIKGPTQPLEHINTYNPQTLASIGKRAGLKPVKTPFLIFGNRAFPDSLLPLFLCLKLTKTRLFFRKVL